MSNLYVIYSSNKCMSNLYLVYVVYKFSLSISDFFPIPPGWFLSKGCPLFTYSMTDWPEHSILESQLGIEMYTQCNGNFSLITSGL